MYKLYFVKDKKGQIYIIRTKNIPLPHRDPDGNVMWYSLCFTEDEAVAVEDELWERIINE